MVFGDSGLLQYAQDARNYQANADYQTGDTLNRAVDYIEDVVGAQ